MAHKLANKNLKNCLIVFLDICANVIKQHNKRHLIGMNGMYVIIGGNQGKREEFLAKTCMLIEKEVGFILQKSSVYETAAWGNTQQASFLNQVLFVETELMAMEVLVAFLQIEKDLGRVRHQKWEPRNIDIDILYFNDEIHVEKKLFIPHPEMHKRKFVLMPLQEIAAFTKHPILHLSCTELLLSCTDELTVSRVPAMHSKILV
jgi:2-amino-4-hydroxy-6-hydroxymethyldihydropteridine diphosphokinase